MHLATSWKKNLACLRVVPYEQARATCWAARARYPWLAAVAGGFGPGVTSPRPCCAAISRTPTRPSSAERLCGSPGCARCLQEWPNDKDE